MSHLQCAAVAAPGKETRFKCDLASRSAAFKGKESTSAANVFIVSCSLLVAMPNAMFIASSGEPAPGAAGEGARPTGSFAAFVDRHSRFVYRIALAVARNPDDAEDVAQETFLQLYRGNRWQQIEDERGYLARVAWRLAVRQRKPRMLEQELPPELHVETRSGEASPEQSAMDRQLETWLHARIDALPEKLLQPLALAALGELKLVEIARILGLPEGTVRRRIHSARLRLKRELMEWKGADHERRK